MSCTVKANPSYIASLFYFTLDKVLYTAFLAICSCFHTGSGRVVYEAFPNIALQDIELISFSQDLSTR